MRALKMLVKTALSWKRQPSVVEMEIIDKFPIDIRTVRAQFGLEAQLTIYASCPKCCSIYAPEYRDGIPIYPSICNYRRTPRSRVCNSALTSTRVMEGKSVRSPLRPFPVQDLDSFVGRMLCHPGIEDAIRSTSKEIFDDTLRDITHSEIVRDLPNAAGMPFVNAGSNDVSLVWALSVDWFNPYHNKIAGKTASVGTIAFTCLSLPPSLRFKPENMFLAAIIPGPKEPSTSEMNHYLRPIVDTFLRTYHSGTWYTRTANYPRGRRCYSAIPAVVADLPATRKVVGFTSHSGNNMCMECHLKKDDINNLDFSTWKERTWEEILAGANAWKNALTKKEQDAITKSTGTRWSELMRLPYWSHHRVAIDGMHNLFMGLTQHHCRVGLGIEVPSGDNTSHIPNSIDIARAQGILAGEKPTRASLSRIPVAALRALCETHGLLSDGPSVPKKKDMIAMLMVRSSLNIMNCAYPFPPGIQHIIVGSWRQLLCPHSIPPIHRLDWCRLLGGP